MPITRYFKNFFYDDVGIDILSRYEKFTNSKT